jgi:hypothetical protein
MTPIYNNFVVNTRSFSYETPFSIRSLWKESLNSNGKQFHQYQSFHYERDDEGYPRNASCELNSISMFLLLSLG